MIAALQSPRALVSRREFISRTGAAAAASLFAPHLACGGRADAPRPRVAVVFTELRFRSHAYNILENCLGPYYFSGKLTDPGVDVVSFYADQFPKNDMAREVSKRFKVPLYKSIDQALCRGGRELAVDAVINIAEHGDYPFNERGQQLYPRKEFFDEAVAVMRRSGRYVPLFNDKHYSYRWDWAKEMFDTARANDMPLLAGSSVPLAQRVPKFELPMRAEIEEAVSVHGGGLETYDFHGLEVLQSMVESRRGGETGIERIELLIGEDFQRAAKSGRWSQDLVDAAMQAEQSVNTQRQVRPRSGGAPQRPKATITNGSATNKLPPRPSGPHAIIVTYKDGLKATVLKVGSDSGRWNFACRLRGEKKPRATALYNGPWGNRCLFKALSHAIQHLCIHKQEPYPAERTLLTTGALEAVMRSYEQGGKPIETPHLSIAYQGRDFSKMRESGASWKIITKDTPQPTGFEPRSFEEL